jgi:hypothetical protein
MIAIGPRELAKAAALTIIASGLLHVAQQCLAGFVQCRALGCLPW